MNYKKLFSLQRELDDHIKCKVVEDVTFPTSKKVLALFVEVGELANEIRCFKYWSKKGASHKEIILDEYVDGLHFFISIVIEMFNIIDYEQLPKYPREQTEINKDKLVFQFLTVYRTIHEFNERQTLLTFIVALDEYLRLGSFIGLDEIEIENAYVKKNNINHKRQNLGH